MSIWYDDLPSDAKWWRLWSGYTTCGRCHGIRRLAEACSVCGDPIPSAEPQSIVLADGRAIEVMPALMGAEGRYEDWVYLMMLEREWKRPLEDVDRFLSIPVASRPAARSAIIIVFWAYFETRIERLLREGMRELPGPVVEELLRRHNSIGARLDRLYRVVFLSTYWSDLRALGFERVSTLLVEVQERRNSFAHGQPAAIDDALVVRSIELLKEEHEGWIAVYNLRAAREAKSP